MTSHATSEELDGASIHAFPAQRIVRHGFAPPAVEPGAVVLWQDGEHVVFASEADFWGSVRARDPELGRLHQAAEISIAQANTVLGRAQAIVIRDARRGDALFRFVNAALAGLAVSAFIVAVLIAVAP